MHALLQDLSSLQHHINGKYPSIYIYCIYIHSFNRFCSLLLILDNIPYCNMQFSACFVYSQIHFGGIFVRVNLFRWNFVGIELVLGVFEGY